MNHLLDKCSYFDPRFCYTYLLNKEETLFDIEKEAMEIA